MRRTLLALAVLAGALVPLAVPSRTLADPPLPEESTITCVSVATAVYPGLRVQLKCSDTWENPTSGVTANFFAAAADAASAQQVVAIGIASQTLNRKVIIRFRTSPTDNPPGCSGADCRKLVGVQLTN